LDALQNYGAVASENGPAKSDAEPAAEDEGRPDGGQEPTSQADGQQQLECEPPDEADHKASEPEPIETFDGTSDPAKPSRSHRFHRKPHPSNDSVLHFYLQLIPQPPNAPRRVLHLRTGRSLLDGFRCRTFLEFPTIYVRDEAPEKLEEGKWAVDNHYGETGRKTETGEKDTVKNSGT
jgi:hypothetical protein